MASPSLLKRVPEVVHLPKLVGFAVSRNIAVPPVSDKCEAPREKIETAMTFPDDSEVIHKTRQRSYGGLTVRKDRDTNDWSTVDKDPFSGSVNDHHLRLKQATVIRRLKS